MALLKSWRTSPPGGFFYRQMETDFEMRAENGEALVDLVVAHRTYKGLEPRDPETVKKEVQRQMCQRLSVDDCKKEGEGDPWVPADNRRPVINMSKVIAFSRAAIEFVKSGMKLVPKSEAQRRAEICKRCPENRAMTGCNCGGYHQLIASSIPAERKIQGLHVCWRCGCDLQSKVNVEDSVIIASNKGQNIEYPAECWQRALLKSNDLASGEK